MPMDATSNRSGQGAENRDPPPQGRLPATGEPSCRVPSHKGHHERHPARGYVGAIGAHIAALTGFRLEMPSLRQSQIPGSQRLGAKAHGIEHPEALKWEDPRFAGEGQTRKFKPASNGANHDRTLR